MLTTASQVMNLSFWNLNINLEKIYGPSKWLYGRTSKLYKIIKTTLVIIKETWKSTFSKLIWWFKKMYCSYSTCSNSIIKVIKLMSSLGLIVHPSKSIISMPRNWIFRLCYKLNKYDINSYLSKEAKKIINLWSNISKPPR